MTGSWVTVTGKRREDELVICLYEASPAGVILPCACAERTPRGTHKGRWCQEGARTWPGDYARRRAGLTVRLDPSSQLPGLPPCGRGQAGAPAAAQRRGRTSLRPASGGRSSRGEEGSFRGWLMRGRVLVPGEWWAEWSHKHPSGAAPVRGRHDHVSGDRAAQSEDRARRWRRLMPQERACPGLGDPPVFTAAVLALPCRWLASR